MTILHHFKEDLTWIQDLADVTPITVMSRTLHILPFNASHVTLVHEPDSPGNEVNGYLRYIMDNYHDLPDQMAFMHAHRSSWHTANQDKLLRVANWNGEGYRSVTPRDKWTVKKNPPHFSHGYIEIQQYWDELFQEELGDPLLEHAMYYCCGTFMVTREMVLLRSLATYQRWYTWVQTDPTKLSGYFFEYTWHRIMGRTYDYNEHAPPTKKCYAPLPLTSDAQHLEENLDPCENLNAYTKT